MAEKSWEWKIEKSIYLSIYVYVCACVHNIALNKILIIVDVKSINVWVSFMSATAVFGTFKSLLILHFDRCDFCNGVSVLKIKQIIVISKPLRKKLFFFTSLKCRWISFQMSALAELKLPVRKFAHFEVTFFVTYMYNF